MKKSRPSKKLGVSAPSRESKTEDGKPLLVPKLRFPEFRESAAWAARTLGKFLIERNEYPQEPVPLFSLTIEDGVTPKTERYERAFLVKDTKDAYKLLLPEDFAFNPMNLRFGAIGRHSGSEAVAVSKYYNIFFCDRTADARFCEFYFRSDAMITFYDNMAIGSLIEKRRVHFSDFLKFDIPFPLLAEQQKIAACLSSVDELMAAQGRKVDALKTHKKGLMQQLFPREGETQPRLRFPEFQNAGEWNLSTVGGLVEAGCLFAPKDGNHGNIHPKSSDYVAQGIPFIMASDLNDGLIDIENCHFISKEQADTLQKGFAKEGDVLLSHKGTVGEVAVVRKIHTPYLMLTPQVTYYRVKDWKKLSNEFLAQLFLADAFQANLVEVSGGGTRAYIGITEQAKLRVQLPKDVEEQQCIATCLSSLDALITAETQKLEALKTHKRGLMQQLFPSPEVVEA